MPLFERKTEAEPVLECPLDGAAMEKTLVEGVTVDRCGSCGGRWFDAKELRRATKDKQLEALATRIPTLRTVSAFRCPRCGGECLEGHVYEVAVDHCLSCDGVWLDAGELEEAKRLLRVERILENAGPGFRGFLARL